MKYTAEELQDILEKHKKWRYGQAGGERAYLRNADLTGADLTGAYLIGAYLTGADLTGADLTGAYLRNADLRNAYLIGADLTGATVDEKTTINFPIACPETGSFIGWKKAGEKIVKLQICEDARRSSATGRKCRCDKALVLEIQELDGTKSNLTEVNSDYSETFVYKVGEVVSEPKFYSLRWEECAPGIHFFITR